MQGKDASRLLSHRKTLPVDCVCVPPLSSLLSFFCVVGILVVVSSALKVFLPSISLIGWSIVVLNTRFPGPVVWFLVIVLGAECV